MRLLVVTSFCDPDHTYAGHVPHWVAAIARHCASVDVVALDARGPHPPNVRYHSLGRGQGVPRALRWARFGALAARLMPRCDAVFCMFSPAFVIGVWPFARALGRPVALWYAHGAVPPMLRVAERLGDRMVTSSPHGFRLPSRKLAVVGQGIDTDLYAPAAGRPPRPFTVVSVGRLSRVKRFEDLVDAAALLVERGVDDFLVRVIGGEPEHGDGYGDELRRRIADRGVERWVRLDGPVPQAGLPDRYRAADAMVNLGETGSMDKVVLEAMATGIPVLSANEAYRDMLGRVDPRLVVPPRAPGELAERLTWLRGLSPESSSAMGGALRAQVVAEHSLDRLARRLRDELDALARARGRTPSASAAPAERP